MAGATAAPQTSTLQLPVPREETVVIRRGDGTITIPDSWNPFTPRGYQSYAYGWNSALNDMILYHNVEAKTAEEEFIGWIGSKFETTRTTRPGRSRYAKRPSGTTGRRTPRPTSSSPMT